MSKEVVKLEERVTIYGTGKGHMVAGKAYEVHPLNAACLVKAGKASYDKVEKK